jgi:DTW domain-containing protein YfiP
VRSRTPPGAPGRCPRCWLLSAFCACDLLRPLPVRTPFAVLRHARESSKSTSSVRWARLVLPCCAVIEYRSRAMAPDLVDVRAGDWLLYPDEPRASAAPTAAVQRLWVLDGTWRQTRRMLRALPALTRLPRLGVPPRPAGIRLRAAPRSEALSTFEAMAGAVHQLESESLGEALLGIHDALVERVLRSRGRRRLEQAA